MFFSSLIFCGFTVIHAALLAEQNKDVILPCSFTPGENVVIHWTTNDNKNVHSYYTKENQLQSQDKSYSGRTSLFLSEISKGNASLLIRDLKKSDENTYNCYMSTNAGKKEDKVTLQVIAALLAEQNKDVILPCSFTPGENVVIHWTTNDNKNVHSYYTKENQLESQDKSYSGRTSLFLSEISKGNASLLIRDLKKSDENTYNCYMSTDAGKKEDKVTLQVIDLQHTMEYTWDGNGLLNLTCSVNTSYMEGITIKWYENGQMVHEDQSTYSSYTVQNDSVTCTIDHSIVHSSWTGAWTMKERILKKDDNITCGCTFCKGVSTDFYSSWYFRKVTNEVPIASMNNSPPVISTDYKNRVHKDENENLNLTNLRANDTGIYICLIKTEQKMNIVMINMTVEGTRQRWAISLAVILVVICLVLLIISRNRN
ncbi:HERV-H LTR-associating protein 2 [Bufo bufo]|uniref:HERV-H LTR-associating protein 2 n=1 Tax=Bufo bufo TaxID=8384 RepID=UPI001ABDCDFB|nr:HERV-H LTR-associating protein 2 [Bufo bufo]XP_040280838.1 HERV-H LTR-associating protein 2 [Bufo bufo]XP_040280839.1 HERV-H LTR-associating protein 2 [Bufo bufo]XP_040280840.1 HERV-H LTR-associating protein 2 [Bufo bufo]XP_040280841.1 HERV-H LTR-associating protein 2 [Bufo bufo]XP_040280842.1 HERV-H LTR-associating protein 2 [Bufo bufo]